ncbi:MAG: DNA (cytosine-5-)-methyltransferase [Sulfurimonas sp. RIFCSPHIGHO2_12_FULL_36_9]|nr:MAG: DNA (cytosine-5-)-methyltransferase [Sulfurimonas sp. RIFCSPLOWO2_02_FULL_36_28]OHD98587.1 MAG: DNA (cytosine-5-)-methyltransferase [Sulfurimonas sp. RIFCSPHIGHO2_12_FULL_36_9]OHE02172.1 MAG: DNA (cytosine-5-)-methyltransferase [Sulfurimonas sp. RIFCSPLOWO2_12_36_12]OHE05155.1 MAG: DNA (cytosine-5-)-methyltransferase [Sulfurimonas sp. RIFCSPLOWO2_12_FULL_36_74]
MQISQLLSIRTIELFAGVGGFRLGLEKASLKNKFYRVVWSNQWEPSTKTQHASDIYCARFGYGNHSNEDISTVDVADIPEHDLLVGGFPCQDYSVASTLKNSHGIIGKKGVLWWEIYRILEQKKEKAPKYLMLENVDRLLKSPASQRGRDFAIILSSLNSLGYGVEWRVINASDYGMPQRRRRIFIMAYKKGTKLHLNLKEKMPQEILNKEGIFAKTFPIKTVYKEDIVSLELADDLVDITNNFNKNSPKKNSFYETGYMIDGVCYTATCKAEHQGDFSALGDFLQDEKDVPKEFYITEEELEKWKYHKGSKSIERVNKTTGHKYLYSEGSMGFPDCLKKPSRTIITGEGGASASRFKHVVCVDGRYRRLTPVELERLNMFPDNHTIGVSDSKRAFLMGNALVVGVVERLGNKLLEELE